MEESTIQMQTKATAKPAEQISISDKCAKVKITVTRWLDKDSVIYSRLCDEKVTRRIAIHVNLITISAVVTAIAIEQAPLTSLAAAISTAILVFNLRQSNNKKGGKK